MRTLIRELAFALEDGDDDRATELWIALVERSMNRRWLFSRWLWGIR